MIITSCPALPCIETMANTTIFQACISTLALRNMVTPFRADRNLLEQACPMEDVLGHISAQLLEYKALKEGRGSPQENKGAARALPRSRSSRIG